MKKILIIGMVDSIHTAHWIERIVDLHCEIHIYPSRTHRRIHPLLRELIKKNQNLRLINSFPSQKFSPYANFLTVRVNIGKFNLYSWLLKRAIETKSYSHIHCLELQHAGYLLLQAKSAIHPSTQIICTNWGSDIYHFSQIDSHLKKIRELLNLTDSYAAECERDYELARKMGFSGKELPLIPNSFKLNSNVINPENVTARSQIIVKCYGEVFGLGIILISVIDKFLDIHQDAAVLLYSVTDDLLSDAKNLKRKFPKRVRISSIRNPLSSNQIAAEYQKSLIYIGASRSDGISTSFLEAMNYGAFPIQTNTSCAQDWIDKGCVGRVVAPDKETLLQTLNDVYGDLDAVKIAAKINLNVLKKYTDASVLKEISKSFYTL
jgi:hypothetical protein